MAKVCQDREKRARTEGQWYLLLQDFQWGVGGDTNNNMRLRVLLFLQAGIVRLEEEYSHKVSIKMQLVIYI